MNKNIFFSLCLIGCGAQEKQPFFKLSYPEHLKANVEPIIEMINSRLECKPIDDVYAITNQRTIVISEDDKTLREVQKEQKKDVRPMGVYDIDADKIYLREKYDNDKDLNYTLVHEIGHIFYPNHEEETILAKKEEPNAAWAFSVETMVDNLVEVLNEEDKNPCNTTRNPAP